MRNTLFLLAVAACGGSSSPASVDAPPSQIDGTVGSDSSPPGDGPALPAPQPLVPTSLGGVRDFAFTATDIYPIVNIAGKLQLVRCPIAGCSATPQVIGQAGTSIQGRGVVISGNSIFWLQTDKKLMRANLDGTMPAVRYEFLEGQIEEPLRAADGVIYFNYSPTNFHGVVMALTATGTSAPQMLAATQATDVGFLPEIDVAGGKIAYWHDIQGTDPRPIELYDIATGNVTPIATSVDMSELVLAKSGIAWVEQKTNTADVRGCLFGTTCNTAPMGAPTFVALAAYEDHVYFSGRTADNKATIVTCSVQDLAASTCTPTLIAQPANQIDLLNTRVIKATADAVYVGTDPQGGGSMWRIPL